MLFHTPGMVECNACVNVWQVSAEAEWVRQDNWVLIDVHSKQAVVAVLSQCDYYDVITNLFGVVKYLKIWQDLLVQQPNPISGLDVVLEYKVFLNADYRCLVHI